MTRHKIDQTEPTSTHSSTFNGNECHRWMFYLIIQWWELRNLNRPRFICPNWMSSNSETLQICSASNPKIHEMVVTFVVCVSAIAIKKIKLPNVQELRLDARNNMHRGNHHRLGKYQIIWNRHAFTAIHGAEMRWDNELSVDFRNSNM